MRKTRNGVGWISPGLMLDFHLLSFLCSAVRLFMHESCNKLALLQDSAVVFPTFHTFG